MPRTDLELEEPYPGHLKDLMLAWSALGGETVSLAFNQRKRRLPWSLRRRPQR